MNAFEIGEEAEYYTEENDAGLSDKTGWVPCEIIAGPFNDGFGEAYSIQVAGEERTWRMTITYLRKPMVLH